MLSARLSLHSTRRIFGLWCVLLLLLPVIAACGGAADTPEAPAEEPAAEEVAEEPATDAAPEEPVAEEPVAEEPAAEEPAAEEPAAEEPAAEEPAAEEPAAEEPAAPATGDAPVAIDVGGAYPILQTPQLQFGSATHLFYTDYQRTLQLAENVGFGWVRQQIHWKDIERDVGPGETDYGWQDLDVIVDAVNAQGLKLLVSIVRSPPQYTADGSDGLPENPENLGDFVEDMVLRYGDRIHAYQIWNEQNLAHETGGVITVEDAGKYVEMLMVAYERIKAVNPNAYVITGAPSPTNFSDPAVGVSDTEYLIAMYEYRDGIINNYFDAQGVHPMGGANPPETLYPDNPSNADGWNDHPSFYFRHIENIRDIMERYGMENHQIWISEFGWATENVTPGYEYGSQNSFEDQADYISRAVRLTYEDYPWVGNMFLWNLNFAVTWNQVDPPQPLHEQAAFGILNPDWSPRPAYTALQGTLAQIKAEQAEQQTQ